MASELAAKTAKLLGDIDDALEQLMNTRQKLWALVAAEAGIEPGAINDRDNAAKLDGHTSRSSGGVQ